MNSLLTHIIQNELLRKGVSDYTLEDRHTYNLDELKLDSNQFVVVYEMIVTGTELVDVTLRSATNLIQYDNTNTLPVGTDRWTRYESTLISVHYAKLKLNSAHPTFTKYVIISY